MLPTRSVLAVGGADLDAEQLLRRVMDDATRLLDAERSTLFLVDRERQQLWSKIAQGLEIQEIRMPLDTGIAGHVATTGKTLSLRDAYEDPRFDTGWDTRTGYRTTSMLAMPLRSPRGAIVGVIEVLNRRDGAFTPADEAALAGLCAQAARLVDALDTVSRGAR